MKLIGTAIDSFGYSRIEGEPARSTTNEMFGRGSFDIPVDGSGLAGGHFRGEEGVHLGLRDSKHEYGFLFSIPLFGWSNLDRETGPFFERY